MKGAEVIVDPFAPVCEHCGGPIPLTTNGRYQRFCSAAHRRAWHTAQARNSGLVRQPVVKVTPIAMREREERKRREAVTKDLPAWVMRWFGYRMLPFHQVLLEGLFAGGMREYLLPTEHAKTTYGAVIFPIASAAADPDARHIVGATNLREAQMRVKTIKGIIETNPGGLTNEYPWLRRTPNRPWTVNELWFQGAHTLGNINPSVTAIGRGASDVKGRRAKTVFDDLEGMNEVLTEAERKRLWDWLTLEAIRVFEDSAFFSRPLLALLGTPYSTESLYFRAQRAGFHVFKQPYRYPDGTLIWPEKRRKILVLKRALSTTPGAFEIAMKLDPRAADPDAMSYDEIREKAQADASRFDESVGHFKFNFLDPAGGSTNKRVDYAGIGHIKIRWPRPVQQLEHETPADVELPWVEVYEPRAFKHSNIAQVKLLQQLFAKYAAPVIYEVNGLQATSYRRLFETFAPEVPLIGFHTNERNKWDPVMGFRVVGDIARAGRLKIFGRQVFEEDDDDEDADLFDPSDADDLLELQAVSAGDVRDPGVRTLLEEVRNLSDPKAHNHIVAGIWFAVHHSWELRRSGGYTLQTPRRPIPDAFTDRSEMLHRMAGYASYVPGTGYGGGRVIDLRQYKHGRSA